MEFRKQLSTSILVYVCGPYMRGWEQFKSQGTFSGRRKQHSLEMTVVTFSDDILNYEFRRCIPKLGQFML